MTDLPGDIQLSVGNTYGLRKEIKYGFKQSKNELGWADYRVTDYQEIERWWEIIFSAYLMVSLQSSAFKNLKEQDDTSSQPNNKAKKQRASVQRTHSWWQCNEASWTCILNNLRLIVQPKIFLCLIYPWLEVFPIPGLVKGFLVLIGIINQFKPYLPDG